MYASNGGSPASSNISIVDINTMSNRQFHNPALKEFLRQLQDPVPNSGNNNAGAGKNQEAQQNNSQNNNNSHEQFKMIVTSLLVQMDDMSARLHDIKEIQRDLSIKQINMENMLLKFMKNGGSGSTSNANSNGCNFSNSSMNSSEKDESNSTKSGDRKLNEHENGSSDSNNVQITSGNSNEVEGPTSGSNRSNVSSDNTNNSKNSSKRSSRSDEEVGKKEKKHEKQGNKNNKEQQILKKEDKERLQKIQDELLEKNSQTSKSLNPLPLSDDDAENNNNNKTEKPANRIEDDRRSKAASSIAEQFLAQQVNKCSNVLKIAEDQEDLMVDTIKSDNEPKTVVEVDLHKKTEKLTVKNSNNKPQLDLKQIAVNKANLIENLNNLRKKTENLSASQNTIQAILMGRQQAQAQNAAHLQAQANSIQVQAVKQAQAAANVIQNQQNLMAIHQQQQQQLNQTQRLLQLNTQSSEHNKSGNEEINIETIPENENNVSTTAAEELLRPALKRKMVQPQTNNLPLNNSLLLQLAQSQNNNNAKNSSNLNQPPKIIQQTVNQNNVLNQTNNLGNLNIQNNSLNLSNFQNIINKQRHESASAALCGASSAASNISNSTNLQNNNPTTATAAAAGLGANKLNAPLPLTININSNGTNNIEVNNNIPSSRSNIEWLAGQNGQVSAPIAGTGQFNFQAPLHRSESLRSLNSIDLTHNSPALTPQLSSTSQTPLISNLPSLLHNNNRNLILQNTSSGLTSPYHNLSGSHSSLNGISLNNSLHNVSSHSLHHSHSHSHHHSHHDEITNQATLNNEQFCNVKRHMTLIQKLVTEHAKTHGPGCKFVKNFALCKSIWELNRLSKKNPHVSLMKKMLQEMPEKEWPTPQVKGFVEGSIKKSEMPNTQIFLLNDLLMQFFTCYKSALSQCQNFIGDPDLELSNDEFTKIMVTSFAIRNRQPQTQAKLQRKQESEIMRHELLKKFKSDFDFPAPMLAQLTNSGQSSQTVSSQANLIASLAQRQQQQQQQQQQAAAAVAATAAQQAQANTITVNRVNSIGNLANINNIQNLLNNASNNNTVQNQTQQSIIANSQTNNNNLTQPNTNLQPLNQNTNNQATNLTALINKNGFLPKNSAELVNLNLSGSFNNLNKNLSGLGGLPQLAQAQAAMESKAQAAEVLLQMQKQQQQSLTQPQLPRVPQLRQPPQLTQTTSPHKNSTTQSTNVLLEAAEILKNKQTEKQKPNEKQVKIETTMASEIIAQNSSSDSSNHQVKIQDGEEENVEVQD